MKTAELVTKIGALLIASGFLAGCATTVDLSKFHDADLKEAEIMPSKDQLQQQRIKVVVFEADEGRSENAKNAQLGDTFAKAVEKELSAAGTEIVDRNLAGKLSDELKLAESRGAGSYMGPQVAQFAIRGKLNAAEYGTTFHEATNWRDSKGENHYTAPYYDHQGKVSGSISVYELPSLRLITTINVGGNASATDPVAWGNWSAGQKAGTGATLLRTATTKAISNSGHELKNLFAPKGYVVERRVDGDKSIFKVLMGREQGVKSEDKVVIYTLRKKTNALTGKEQTDEIPVAEAKVSDQVTADEAWVVPENKDTAGKVRLGDYVKVKYEEKSLLSKLAE